MIEPKFGSSTHSDLDQALFSLQIVWEVSLLDSKHIPKVGVVVLGKMDRQEKVRVKVSVGAGCNEKRGEPELTGLLAWQTSAWTLLGRACIEDCIFGWVGFGWVVWVCSEVR